MEDAKIVDFREQNDGGKKMVIKLSKENISQLLSGKILEGFNTRIGVEIVDGK